MGLGYLHNDKDTGAVKLISRFRMHNNRVKFKEEQIKKLAHSLTADSELKNLQEKKGSKNQKGMGAYYLSSGGMIPKSSEL